MPNQRMRSIRTSQSSMLRASPNAALAPPDLCPAAVVVGRRYFYNKATGHKSWHHKPASTTSSDGLGANSGAAGLPEDWAESFCGKGRRSASESPDSCTLQSCIWLRALADPFYGTN